VKEKIIKRTFNWLPVIIWALLIFKFSSGSVPKASPDYWQDFAVKKFGHILLFGILAVFLYRGFLSENIDKKKAALWSVVLSTLYGASDEFHQSFTGGREARIRDVFFDGIGASIFVYITYKFLQKLPKKVQSFLVKAGLI
jgi:VanZ family protein